MSSGLMDDKPDKPHDVEGRAANEGDGVLRTDEAVPHEVGGDFGHIVHQRPAAVLQPRGTAEVAGAVESGRSGR